MVTAADVRSPWSRVETLDGRVNGPLLVTAAAGADVEALLGARTALFELFNTHHALLFRGFGVDTVDRFDALLAGWGTTLMDYTERSTPRSRVNGRIFTSTEYPRTQSIPQHNESSYSLRWPRRVFFCCLQPAANGGETPIADGRRVYEAIDPDIRSAFIDRQVMYVRNYGQGVDLSWQDAFQTADRAAVESYCRTSDVSFEWFDEGTCLRTWQVRPAALVHEPTGEQVWFNQAHLFHVSSLEPGLRHALTALFPPERLPRHASFGDGTPIQDEAIRHVADAYRRTQVVFAWQPGDLLMLDNLFYSHGRLPFAGERRVLVALEDYGGAPATAL